MSPPRFQASFTQQEAFPEAATQAVVAVLRGGRLHRYNLAEDEVGETVQLEKEYADWQGGCFCLAVASAGQAIRFRVPGLDETGCETVIAKARACGVELKWMGARGPRGFTLRHRSWRFVSPHDLPDTDAAPATPFDMRPPLTFSPADGARIGQIIREVVTQVTP